MILFHTNVSKRKSSQIIVKLFLYSFYNSLDLHFNLVLTSDSVIIFHSPLKKQILPTCTAKQKNQTLWKRATCCYFLSHDLKFSRMSEFLLFFYRISDIWQLSFRPQTSFFYSQLYMYILDCISIRCLWVWSLKRHQTDFLKVGSLVLKGIW